MKQLNKVLLLCVIFTGCSLLTNAQGKFAGSMQTLIGKSYTDNRNIAGLEEWKFREGSILSAFDEPQTLMVDLYQKGANYVIFFSLMEDTASHVYVITDAIEITNVKKEAMVKTSLCRRNKQEDPMIVALLRPVITEYMTDIRKAWRYNRDKNRVEAIPVKGIDCMFEGL